MSDKDERLTLKPEQIHFLNDVTNYMILAALETPMNPSEAAKHLNMPANTLHYRINRLAEAGLLRITAQNGRSKTYQTTSMKFRLHRDLLPTLSETFPTMLHGLLRKVEKQLLHAIEDDFDRDLQDLAEDEHGFVHFDINDDLPTRNFAPVVHVLEFPVQAKDYNKLTLALKKTLEEFERKHPKDSDGTLCTFSFLAFEGRASTNGNSAT